METTVNRLNSVLKTLAPAVAKQAGGMPILQNVVVGAGKAWADNLETAITVPFPDAAVDPLLLPHRQLSDLLRGQPRQAPVSINRTGQVINLKLGGTSVVLSVPGELRDFPPQPVVVAVGGGTVAMAPFLKSLVTIAGYASTSYARPALQCVCVILGDSIVMVSADGFRLAWQTVPAALTVTGGSDMTCLLVPTTAAGALARAWRAAGQEATAQVHFSPTRLQLAGANAVVNLRLGEGAFPDYQKLIPTDFSSSVSFLAEEARQAVRIVGTAAKIGSDVVRLQWDATSMTFSATAEGEATITSTIDTLAPAVAGKIAFHHAYLTQYLTDKQGPVRLETTSPSNPGLFSHAGSPGVVIMPMFVRW